jgi:hypothetical protein
MDDNLNVRQRPVGVTLLAILALIGAVMLTALMGAAAVVAARGDSRIQQMSAAMAEIGIPMAVMVVGIVFLIILSWASGIGMWIGAKWGWHCGAFWYAYAIVRNFSALLTVYGTSEIFEAEASSDSSRGPEYYYLKFSARLIISFLIYLYFFKANVRVFRIVRCE